MENKEIEEMAKIMCRFDDEECEHCVTCSFHNGCACEEDAKDLYNAGYRKIHDDHQRQCTCYALGCQMAEQLERKIALKVIEEASELARRSADEAKLLADTENDALQKSELRGEQIGALLVLQALIKLKKKYTEVGNE